VDYATAVESGTVFETRGMQGPFESSEVLGIDYIDKGYHNG
jgi:hypothetical protein